MEENSEELTEMIWHAKAAEPGLFVSNWDTDDIGIAPEPDLSIPKNRLLWAAENGFLKELQDLLGKTSQASELINGKDQDGYTALHRAAYNDHVDCVKYLLSNGSDAAAKTNDGWQPLHSAARWGSFGAVDILLKHSAVNINAQTNGGITPLHLAVSCTEKGALQTAQRLLQDPRIDISIEDGAHETGAKIAQRQSLEMIRLFDPMAQPISPPSTVTSSP